MLRIIRQTVVSLGERQRRALRDQSGQSLVILAFAFLGLIAMLGLALDLGLVYIERVRIKRAVDAATLAGVVELPFEEDSFSRALEYLELNGYLADPVSGDANVYVQGCIRDFDDWDGDGSNQDFVDHTTPYTYIQVADPRNSFILTAVPAPGTDRPSEICDADSFGNANRLAVTGTVTVDMNFMQFFGFGEVPVMDWAVAQNVTDLDVVVVFDISGSMEYSTICYDCWVRTDSTNPDYPNNGYPNPIPSDVPTSQLCSGTQVPHQEEGYRYLIAEAELAAYNRLLWQTLYRQTGAGYWAIQRGSRSGDWANRAGDPARQSSNVCLVPGIDCTVPGDPSDDLCNNDPGSDVFVDCSGYITHRPSATYGQGAPPAELLGMFYYLADVIDNDPPPPRLEYDFVPNWTGATNIWIRAQGGGARSYEPIYQNPFILNRSTLHWDVRTSGDGFNPATNTAALGNNRWRDNRADPGEWRWIRLGSANATANEALKLTLWAGSSGYDIDKIVVTNDPRTNSSQIDALSYDYPAGSGNNIGRPATQGSATRAACDPCNPIYGSSVTPGQCTGFAPVFTDTNHLADPLFSGIRPLRPSKEAVKRFIQRLDPEFDQAGFVPFTTNVDRYDQSQLTCRKRDGQACFDPVVQNPPISYTNVLVSVEGPVPEDSTDIAEGMRNGLEVLGVNVRNRPACGPGQDPYVNNCWDNTCDENNDHTGCGRGGAAKRVMVVLTDGSPNQNPGGGCGSDPVYNFPAENDDDYDCVIYYAHEAQLAGVSLYTIGLGDGARGDLLTAAAEQTDGRYFFAPTPEDLDGIFDQILSNIYVRLIR